MHFFAGVWVGGVALWLYLSGRSTEHCEALSAKCMYLVSVLSILAVGVFWEIFEFGLDRIVEFTPIYDVADTLSDLFFDVFGAVVVTYFILLRLRKKKSKKLNNK